MTPQPPQPPFGAPPPQPQGFFARNWKLLLLLGCALPSALCCGGFGVIYFGVSKVIKSSPVYVEALSRALGNAEVKQALGDAITPGLMLTGSTRDNGATGSASLSVPLEGSKGKGTLIVVASKLGSRWSYSTMEVQVQGGPTIDLLGGGGGGTAPPEENPPPGEPADP